MARFIFSISLAVVVINSMFAFSQKYEPIPVCKLVDETALLENAPSSFSETPSSSVTVNIYSNFNSNYLTLEVVTPKAVPFQLVNAQGYEMYSGTIRGTQLIETELWPQGTYYFLCGTKRETIYIMR